MTVQRHDRPHPDIERTFTAVRAALPAASVAAFDAQLEAITHLPVVDLAALADPPDEDPSSGAVRFNHEQ